MRPANASTAWPWTIQTRGYGCHACPIRCGRLVQSRQVPLQHGVKCTAGVRDTGSAGHTLFERSVEPVIKANEICNLYA